MHLRWVGVESLANVLIKTPRVMDIGLIIVDK